MSVSLFSVHNCTMICNCNHVYPRTGQLSTVHLTDYLIVKGLLRLCESTVYYVSAFVQRP